MSEVVAAWEQCLSGQPTSISIAPPPLEAEDDALTFLNEAAVHTAHQPGPTKKTATRKNVPKSRNVLVFAISGALAGLVAIAVVIGRLLLNGGESQTDPGGQPRSDKPATAQSTVAKLSPLGKWQIDSTDETGSKWLGQMELITTKQGTIAGHIDWTVSGGGHNGLSGHENVSATFDPANAARCESRLRAAPSIRAPMPPFCLRTDCGWNRE